MYRKFRAEEKSLRERHEAAFLALLDDTTRRATGKAKKCSCTAGYLCRLLDLKQTHSLYTDSLQNMLDYFYIFHLIINFVVNKDPSRLNLYTSIKNLGIIKALATTPESRRKLCYNIGKTLRGFGKEGSRRRLLSGKKKPERSMMKNRLLI